MVDTPRRAAPSGPPALDFTIEGGEGLHPAATPTLRFALRIAAPGGAAVRSVVLDVQIQIAARRRGYVGAEQARLADLFGTPERWATTLRTVPWLRMTAVVPPFEETTAIALDVPCTYDLDVTASRYFAGLAEGAVPLEFLFSGSVFYTGEGGMLQTARIGWDSEADYALPVSVWREMIERHFAGTGYVRLGHDLLQRLGAYKSAHGHLSWEAAVEALLAGAQDGAR